MRIICVLLLSLECIACNGQPTKYESTTEPVSFVGKYHNFGLDCLFNKIYHHPDPTVDSVTYMNLMYECLNEVLPSPMKRSDFDEVTGENATMNVKGTVNGKKAEPKYVDREILSSLFSKWNEYDKQVYYGVIDTINSQHTLDDAIKVALVQLERLKKDNQLSKIARIEMIGALGFYIDDARYNKELLSDRKAYLDSVARKVPFISESEKQ